MAKSGAIRPRRVSNAASDSPGDQPAKPRGGADVGAMFTSMDADKDGKLSGDEIPAQMQSRLSDIDTDSDGAISKAELTQAMKKLRGAGGGGREGGGDAASRGVGG